MNGALLSATTVREGLVFRSAPPAWVIWLVIVPAVILVTWFLYRLSGDARPAVRRLLTTIRILALAFVIALLFNPSRETQIVERQKTLAVVMVDTSASMDHKDGYETSPELSASLKAAANIVDRPIDAYSRLDLVKAVLDRQDRKFLDELAKNHEIRVYAFGDNLQSVPNITELEARGRSTALGAAIERVLEEPEVKSRPTGGIIVLSDGKNTSGPPPEAAVQVAERRKIPIHAVGVGDPRALRDIELVALRADSVVLLDDEMVMDLKVRNRGYPTSSVELRIINAADGQVLHQEQKTLLASEDDQTLDLRYKPTREGDQQWIVEVKPLPGEHSTDNNRKTHEVRIRRSKLRILYVDGFPRWEYRKLKNFLKRDKESFETQCILQSAQIDFIQEASPMLTPLRKFPSDEAELFKYDVIIFGDVDPDDTIYFGADPALRRRIFENIRKFVEHGGGFAMIAGETFSPRAYKDTPLEDVLPIVIDPAEDTGGGGDLQATFKPRLTVLGKVHPVMQLDSDPKKNTQFWESEDAGLPGFYWFARVKKEKPGARVLAQHPNETNDHGAYPLLVAGTFGDGPVFFCAVDEIWRWFNPHGPKYAHQFWGNMVRYLGRARLYAGDKRFALSANRSRYEVGDRITFTAYVKEKDFRPATKSEQEVVLKTPAGAGSEQRILLKRTEDGVFEKSMIATEIGDYQAWILPEDTLSDEKISPISFSVRVSDIERREPILDEPTLEMIAKRTGGRYVTLPKVDDLIETIGSEAVEVPQRREFKDLRKEPWIPAIFLALLTIEWLIRKRFRYL
jgi:uncharacterized membrane protein